MTIPLSRPYVDEEIRCAVLRVVNSGRYILGPECRGFEEEFSRYIGTKHAVLTSSGTAALHLALLALGVGPGDEVLVPSLTAFPTVEAIMQTGATPIFVDIDPSTFCVDPSDSEGKVTARTVGIIPVHLYGHPADLDRLQFLAQRHGLFLLEDCCQAHGAQYRGRRVGSFGRAAAFSFYPSKNLTVMGDGGILTTDDDEIAARVRRLRDHGRRDKYTHDEVGYNLRFNEIQAAVGRVQLPYLERFSDDRRTVADAYRRLLKDLPVTPPGEALWARVVYHLFVIRTQRRDELSAHLRSRGIETGVHYPVPCHLQPAVTRRHPRGEPLLETERAAREILSLPMYPTLTEGEIGAVVEGIRSFFEV